MEAFLAIQEKIGEIDGEILNYHIKLDELKIRREAFCQARDLVKDKKSATPAKKIIADAGDQGEEFVFRKDGRLFKAREALRKLKRPMTTKEIMKACKFSENKRKYFGNNLSTAINKGKCFYRPQKGKIGLLELKRFYKKEK